LPTFRTNLQLI